LREKEVADKTLPNLLILAQQNYLLMELVMIQEIAFSAYGRYL